MKTLCVLLCATTLTACIPMRDKCADYGFQFGSEGYANCRMQVDQQREENFQRTLDRLHATAAADRAAQQQHIRRMTTCNTYGNRTTCY